MTGTSGDAPGGAAPASPRWGLGPRLMLALALVLLVGGLTAAAVALAVGPGVFHEHMVRAGVDDHDAAVLHAEEAFRSAGGWSLALALGAAAVTSLAVCALLTRRVGRSLGALAHAASGIGAGRYGARVGPPGLGAEFDDLAAAFNRMADDLAEADRLRSRLLADVAHELRTPVATLVGYLEAVEDGVQPLDAGTVAVLRAQGDRLTRLAGDLAAVTRAESGELVLDRRPVAARTLLDAAARAAADRAAAAGVDLAVTGSSDAVVQVDADRVAQVLDNLLSNALRHTPRGGRVVLDARREGDRVLLRVADTGDGIAAEHLPHVFERFYRADTARDRDHGGSGIGLAISRALAEAHGGTLTATSPGPGRGTAVVLALPAADGPGRV